MFASVSHKAHLLQVTCTTTKGTKYDLFRYIVSSSLEPIDQRKIGLSESYPSARWERALHTWASSNQKKQIRYFLKAMCNLLPEETILLEWRVQQRHILPKGSPHRFLLNVEGDNSSTRVDCVGQGR